MRTRCKRSVMRPAGGVAIASPPLGGVAIASPPLGGVAIASPPLGGVAIAAFLVGCVMMAAFLVGGVTMASFLVGCGSNEPTSWGDPVPEEEVQTIEAVVNGSAPPDEHAGVQRSVVLRGIVEDVCPHAGCWFIVRDGRQEIYVDLQGGIRFTVPRSLRGRRVRVAGKVNRNGGEVRLIGTGVVIEE